MNPNKVPTFETNVYRHINDFHIEKCCVLSDTRKKITPIYTLSYPSNPKVIQRFSDNQQFVLQRFCKGFLENLRRTFRDNYFIDSQIIPVTLALGPAPEAPGICRGFWRQLYPAAAVRRRSEPGDNPGHEFAGVCWGSARSLPGSARKSPWVLQ